MNVTREQLANALKAVLEHVGPANQHLDFVGIRGNLIYATDGYTIGISSVGEESLIGLDQEVFLPTKEARDLLRFVRPDRVRDRTMRVEILVAQDPAFNPTTGHPDGLAAEEFHVGLREDDPNADITTSEVYSLYPADYPMVNFKKVWAAMQDIYSQTFFSEEYVMQAGLVARFKAAEQRFGDRMRLWPAAPAHMKHGQRALVTVGSSFIGAIAGLGEPSENNDIPFGDSTLDDWGLGDFGVSDYYAPADLAMSGN